MMMEYKHISVLLDETIDGLKINPEGIYVDGTAGGAGHSFQMAQRLTTGRLIAIDRDPDAIKAATERLYGYSATVVQGNFSNVDKILHELGISRIDGMLLDLGVSSYQLDNAERGFSYHSDAELDMRMSREGISAKDIVNSYSYERLCRILFEYGEEKFAKSIASKYSQGERARAYRDDVRACPDSEGFRSAEGPQGEKPLQKDVSGDTHGGKQRAWRAFGGS